MPQALLIECNDQIGLVHQITGVLYRHGVNIISNQEFVDHQRQRFFMRTEYQGTLDQSIALAELQTLLPSNANIRFARAYTPRILILATKEHHCLGDLLIRHAFAELKAEILGVIANHEQLGQLVQRFDLPFHYLSHRSYTREAHEQALLEVIHAAQPDYLVLAKYMRVLSPQFVAQFPQRIINIHHSFLPAFVGANPYRQAFERGVKIIGATAHFVTDELDQGPIIAQQVMPIDHSHSVDELIQAGREIEKHVLAKALDLVLSERVFLSGNRTVIFD
ncbi:formyltetrahydrofolate deformylase [Herpetosiphon geysericola]|uniref:Formyltetrahydrofolate deformylase n=1 Tax=Herpetosiphon geysericola TaxID=70996 RepID=A0A0N8GR34_9CHLR|nr:formyltetrahydrofolate deformylase [Herpetosiphon geysericola]KPL85386.1 formyltetrahydrofolate deformylase [Herpetosiphon geysericola]